MPAISRAHPGRRRVRRLLSMQRVRQRVPADDCLCCRFHAGGCCQCEHPGGLQLDLELHCVHRQPVGV